MSITVLPEQSSQIAATFDGDSQYNLARRQASALAASDLVPQAFRDKPANCLLVLEVANRLGASVFMVMQNADVIHGRVALRATFLIGCVNNSKRFTVLRFQYDGAGSTRSCYAYATDRETGDKVQGPTVDIAMANAEGWSTKAGSKWKTMPDLMLAYRAGAFFSRLYASDLTLGMHTTDELEDSTPDGRWATEVQQPTVTAEVVDPHRDAFEAVLAAEQWTPKQRTSLRDRYARADAEGRAELVANAQAQLVPVSGQITGGAE